MTGMSIRSNNDRVNSGTYAVVYYQQSIGDAIPGVENFETCAADLIADILHAVANLKGSTTLVLERAEMHFVAEHGGEN